MPTKAEVFMKYFQVEDYATARMIWEEQLEHARDAYPREEYTKFRFPYEAAEHPPIPPLDEIEIAMRAPPRTPYVQTCV